MHFYTHTHPINGTGTTQVSQYQKGKTILDFTEAKDSQWQWHQLGHMQVRTLLQTDNHASTPPLSFFRPDAIPAAQPTASKHWRQQLCTFTSELKYWDISFDLVVSVILNNNFIVEEFQAISSWTVCLITCVWLLTSNLRSSSLCDWSLVHCSLITNQHCLFQRL